jgi:hypothetical protein
MTDPCQNLLSIDFSNDEDLKNILLRDKHTRIEGLCTEMFFYEQILKNNFRETSSGWWFGLKNNTYTVTKIASSLLNLKNIDFELLELFSKVNTAVFIIVFSESDKDFFYLKYQHGKKESILKEWEIGKKRYPKNNQQASIPPEEQRNPHRLNQAIQFLQEQNAIKKCAIERMFANCWLGNAFFWDIDFIIKYKNQLIAFEVKQKFPTAKGTWGLNTGLKNLFNFLNTLAINVIHVILVKPVNNASIPALDLYMSEKYRKDAKWIATSFKNLQLDKAKSRAPNYTSIHSNASLSYYHLNDSDFVCIKKVASDENLILSFLESTVISNVSQ